MEKIIIIGAGGHGQVVAEIITLMHGVQPLCFLDDDTSLHGTELLGIPVQGGILELDKIKHDGVIIAIGDNNRRKLIFERLAAQTHFFTVIHPSAIISPSASIEKGCMILAGTVINTKAKIHKDTIINTNSIVEHHCQIGPHVHIAPGVSLGGNVTVGEETLIGIGATVLPGISIGTNSILGAGSTAIKPIPSDTIAVAYPAKKLFSKW
ncbi:acetyltransferase [Maridesulfovibrio sp.]|uniref:acetyltransferase n=1 Tax=Maridesulfovibrio sp. TaxID=2795000 RepID=UPI002A18BDA7|nr:acetyltransferase [Maridesulfovibrio sp.]